VSFESIDKLVTKAAAEFKSSTAIEVGDRTLSYGDLEDRANNLANLLADAGLEPGDRIGLFTEDRLEMVVAVLASLKAGAVFVPLDTRLPAQRLGMMVETVRPGWYLTSEGLAEGFREKVPGIAPAARFATLGDDGRRARLEAGGAEPADGSWNPEPRSSAAGPEAMSYVYFTSGSTGKPKGIAGRLKAIDHFVRWEIETLGLGSGIRVSQLTGFSFDAYLRDVFVPLAAGGTVCAPPDLETILDARRLADWIDESGIGLVHCVPSLFRTLLDPSLERRFSELRYVLLAGEALLGSDVSKWMETYGEEVRLVNLYGPSETTMTKFYHIVEPADRERESIPLGKPMKGARGVVVDEGGGICAPGQVGEILIRTPYRSLGYVDDPETTAAVFVQNPFSRNPDDVVYRTGDLGTVGPDGNFEFVGRRDHQVKVRGVRIEPAEIEARLNAYPAIENVGVVARTGETGERYLCAYYAAHREIDLEELQAFLAETLPEYMMPSAFVELDELPTTPSGKIDRNALAEAEEKKSQASLSAGEPRTMIEGLLAEIWSEALHVEHVGVHSNFFDLGGHSLVAMRVLARVTQVFGIEVPLREFFESPTLATMAREIEAARSETPSNGSASLERRGQREGIALSFGQERLWFLDRLNPGSSTYNQVSGVHLSGELDLAALAGSLDALQVRQEILRARFYVEEGEPRQRIAPFEPLPLPLVDLGGLAEGDREKRFQRHLGEMARGAFDLERGPLLRSGLLRLSENEHTLIVVLHHVVCDGWSQGLLPRELGELYDALSTGREPRLEPLPIDYGDFAAWQREYLQGEVLENHLEFWKKSLGASHPPIALPTDRPRPPVATSRGRRWAFQVPEELAKTLRGASRNQRATPFMIALSAFFVLLAKLAGQEDLRVGVPVSGRDRPETENLIGMFINTLVIRGEPGRVTSFRELLDRVRETLLDAHAHQELPFEKLVEELQPERDLQTSPLFQVLFAFQNFPLGGRRLDSDLELSPVQPDVGTAKFDLTLSLVDQSQGFRGYLEYKTALFDRTTAMRIVAQYLHLLEAVTERPDLELETLSLLGGAERAQLLSEWNDTARELPAGLRLEHLLERRAEDSSEAVAVVCGGHHVSYRTLAERSAALAGELRRRGIGRGARVALAAEASVERIAALWAVAAAGAAYVPLDPSYPRQRLDFMLSDSGAELLLTQERGSALFAESGLPEIRIDAEAERGAAEADLEAGATAADLAYTIYTSGSTGRPKGVGISHRALVNFLLSMAERPGLGVGERLLAVTPLSFDIAGLEIYLPLVVGATVVPLERQVTRDALALRSWLERERPEMVQATPSTWRLLVEAGWRGHDHLRVLSGGEALGAELARSLAQRAGAVWNLYGPTETTIWSALDEVIGTAPGGSGEVSIGRPIANTRIDLVDRHLRPVPIGVVGELVIGGAGLASGYHGRPALSAEKFVPNPFGTTPGERLYVTGDLARRRADGRSICLGRRDHQVKLRGFRIELGEIETLLEAQPGIAQAVALAREDRPGETRLVAYLVGENGQAPEADQLGVALKNHVPDYMVPSVFISLDALPLTPNGKVDRAALPAPERDRPELAAEFRAPRSQLERTIARIWQEMLDLSEVGIDDNFFDLGGHSLLLLRVHGQLTENLENEISLIELFQYPTIAALAAHLDRGSRDEEIAAERQKRHIARLRSGADRLRRQRRARR